MFYAVLDISFVTNEHVMETMVESLSKAEFAGMGTGVIVANVIGKTGNDQLSCCSGCGCVWACVCVVDFE